jgi:hypothetical protein
MEPSSSLLISYNKHGFKSSPLLCNYSNEVVIFRPLALMMTWPKMPRNNLSGPRFLTLGVI